MTDLKKEIEEKLRFIILMGVVLMFGLSISIAGIYPNQYKSIPFLLNAIGYEIAYFFLI